MHMCINIYVCTINMYVFVCTYICVSACIAVHASIYNINSKFWYFEGISNECVNVILLKQNCTPKYRVTN